MGRHQHEIWTHFSNVSDSQFKSKRAKCNYCKQTVSSTPQNMRTHYNNCPMALKPDKSITFGDSRRTISSSSQARESCHADSQQTLHHLVESTISSEKKKKIDFLFAKAVNETATPFSFFEHRAWVDFFQALAPNWKLPSPRHVSGDLLDTCYDQVMKQTYENIKEANGGTLSIDGATDKMSNSKCNIILHTPLPMFIDYLQTDLKRDTTENVVKKIEDSINAIDRKTGINSTFSFVSDSCNGMRIVRQKIIQKGLVKWVYGCAAHCLNNFCESIGKNIFKDLIKKSVFVAKSIRNVAMIKKIFNSLCQEKFKKSFALPLYSKTRWSSVNYMFQRLNKLSSIISLLPHVVLHEKEARGIDSSYELPGELVNIVSSNAFWKEVSAACKIYNIICQCIGVLEGNATTISTAYASVLYVRMHIYDQRQTLGSMYDYIDSELIRNWNRIYSPVHSLAFKCDPLYDLLQKQCDEKYPPRFVNIGNDVISSCHKAFKNAF